MTELWNPGTVMVGLVGRGIQLSRTPAMHRAEGAAHGLTYVYRLFDTDRMRRAVDLSEILAAADLCGFDGLNITYPYKVEVLDHLDELSEAARNIGAVNTVVFQDGRRIGHNTDFWGFAESFRQRTADAPPRSVLLIGAGGAGAAVGHALAECNVPELRILDAERSRAEALAAKIEAVFRHTRTIVVGDAHQGVAGGVEGIVNATPVGMAALPGTPLSIDLIDPAMLVADIVYFPLETELLKAARAKGCRTISGSGMAVFQAVRAFELFTGLKPDSDRMAATFEAFQPDCR